MGLHIIYEPKNLILSWSVNVGQIWKLRKLIGQNQNVAVYILISTLYYSINFHNLFFSNISILITVIPSFKHNNIMAYPKM